MATTILTDGDTSVKKYVADIEKATPQDLHLPVYSDLPMDGLKPGQYRKLKRMYKIFFWDIMPYDFDKSMRPGESLNVLLQRIRCGSVIILHDQPHSSLIPLLPRFIETAIQRGYSFILPDSIYLKNSLLRKIHIQSFCQPLCLWEY